MHPTEGSVGIPSVDAFPNAWNSAAMSALSSRNAPIESSAPASCTWLYSKGVPQVFTDGHDKEAGPYPYYLHPLYISRFNRLVEKLGQYTRGLPSRLFERIAYVQVKTGSTGDEEAYKGNVNKVSAAFDIDERNFTNFRLAAFKKFHAAFQLGTKPVIPLMFAKISNDNEPENPYQALLDWIVATVRIKWGTKMNGSGQGYQLNGEAWRTRPVLSHVVDPAPGEYDLFTRCEMDQGWKRGGGEDGDGDGSCGEGGGGGGKVEDVDGSFPASVMWAFCDEPS